MRLELRDELGSWRFDVSLGGVWDSPHNTHPFGLQSI